MHPKSTKTMALPVHMHLWILWFSSCQPARVEVATSLGDGSGLEMATNLEVYDCTSKSFRLDQRATIQGLIEHEPGNKTVIYLHRTHLRIVILGSCFRREWFQPNQDLKEFGYLKSEFFDHLRDYPATKIFHPTWCRTALDTKVSLRNLTRWPERDGH